MFYIDKSHIIIYNLNYQGDVIAMFEDSFYEPNQDKKIFLVVAREGPTNYPSHYHKKIEMTYTNEGVIRSIAANVKYEAGKDDILLIMGNICHSYSTSRDADRFILIPTEEIMCDTNPMFAEKHLPVLLSDKEFNREKILPLIEEIYAIRTDRDIPVHIKNLQFKGLVDYMFGHLIMHYSHLMVPKSKEYTLVGNILNYIDENYNQDISLSSISKQFNYNPFYFSKIFNNHIPEGLNNYINMVRINKFIQKIKQHSDSTITQIATQCGFNSMPSFYRAFNKVMQCSPKDYQKQIKSNKKQKKL